MNAAARRVVDGSAWEEFCDTRKSAGAVIQRELSPPSAFDRAEGYRYLSRLVRLALEKFVEHADPGVPNWIDTAGHSRGTMGLRWVKASGHPRPRTRVVKVAEVAVG